MDTDILNKAKYYCARAERSPRNLRLFLMRREVPSDEIDEYLALLQEGRYYDPQRYAESYARILWSTSCSASYTSLWW